MMQYLCSLPPLPTNVLAENTLIQAHYGQYMTLSIKNNQHEQPNSNF